MAVVCNLKIAEDSEVPTIVDLLVHMQDEVKEFNLDPTVTTNLIRQSLNGDATWFLFLDEQQHSFGTCYLQKAHSYWRIKTRYYLGGFYIQPSHRGEGRFRIINQLLDQWVQKNNGDVIFAHIHRHNQKSLRSFGSVDMGDSGYMVRVRYLND